MYNTVHEDAREAAKILLSQLGFLNDETRKLVDEVQLDGTKVCCALLMQEFRLSTVLISPDLSPLYPIANFPLRFCRLPRNPLFLLPSK